MAGEICPNTGDMTDCNKKPRCKWGVCEGQSLPSDGDNCPDGYVFREDYCDCEPVDCGPVCTLRLSYKIVVGSYTGAGCSPTTTTCSAFGGNWLTQDVTNVVEGSTWSYVVKQNEDGTPGNCNGQKPENAYVRVTRCVNGLPTVEDVPISLGGCSFNASAGQEINDILINSATLINCTVNIESRSRLYNNTYDCYDCSGVRTNQTIGNDTVSVTSMTLADYQTAYLDCSNLSNACETSCLWKTAGGKVWHAGGWINVVNCDLAGQPDSGQNFICPNNVSQPCNAFENESLRYYDSSGRLHDAPKLIGS